MYDQQLLYYSYFRIVLLAGSRQHVLLYSTGHNNQYQSLDAVVIDRIQDMNECSFPVFYNDVRDLAIDRAKDFGFNDFKGSYKWYLVFSKETILLNAV